MAEGLTDVPLMWERQPAETDESWLAFRAYRDMPQEVRTIRRAAIASISTLSRWFREHNWAERVNAYDAALETITLEERTRVLQLAARDVAMDHARMLADASELVSRELAKLVDASRNSDSIGLLRPAEVRRLLETTVKLDRLVRGQATENVKTELDVSKLSIDEVRTLEKLLSKATP